MRTSWKVGLATGACEPVPWVTPRTNVVLPAPSSPVSRTTSPTPIRAPSCLPSSSVSAGEFVTRSGKVVVARAAQDDRCAAGVHYLDDAVGGQLAHRLQARLLEECLGADADELGLLAAGQRIFQRSPRRPRHVLGPDHAADSRHGGEFLHLADEAVRDVAAAQAELVEAAAFLELGHEAEGSALAQRDGGGPERSSHRDGPSGLSLRAREWKLDGAPGDGDGQDRRTGCRGHVATY